MRRTETYTNLAKKPACTWLGRVICMFFCLAATVSHAQGLSGSGTAGDPYVIATDVDYTTFVTMVNGGGGNEAACYQIAADVTASGTIAAFSGTLEAAINPTTHMPYRIKSVTAPMFTTLTGTVRNLAINSVSISSGTNVGAVACTANGAARIYNVGILDGSVGGSNYVGGLVGLLDGTARVVNCYSYATITGGSNVGGIVGYNNVATASNNLKTMVFACMFYGEIDTTNCTNIAPVYNGKNIVNKDANGVSNFNYFRGEASYVQKQKINTYNCALLAETRFLQRFEFFRHLLNGHRELAGWWATGTYSGSEMMKWVMLPDSIGTDHPYPILMEAGKYSSVVNIDAEHSTTGKPRNQGGKLGTLTVKIRMGDGAVYLHPGSGETEAQITTPQLILNITDKDPAHFNFNYYKVQLPYYNDVGTKNYTGNRVVTGWKIVKINNQTAASVPSCYSTGEDVTYTDGELTATPYNFADRNCTDKDLYVVSKRVFNQGAYWDVPYGVDSIIIEPYWAKCVYLADGYADVVYNQAMGTAYNVPNVGGGQIYTNRNSYPIAEESQKVFTSKVDAIATSNSGLFQGVSGSSSHTVYDYAVVLVGNYHFYGNLDTEMSKPYTVTSIDLDGDNEPDYSYILRFDSRKAVHPVRVDFINIPGLGMAQKSHGGTGTYNFGIMQPKGWFESTNTSLFRETQFEYDNSSRIAAPYILQGGVMEQWVNGQSGGHANKTTYFHVGGNVWFKEFHRGTHQDQNYDANHSPVSVTGGDFDQFYLTGLYTANATTRDDNAECYITGGRFGVVAGTGMDGLGTSDGKGNITWIVDNADIEEFYAGSFNADKPAIGNLHTIVNGGHIDLFCGGPKFGDMSTGKTVTTTATGCTFGTFFGAGYGGNSYSRQAPRNHSSITNFPHTDSQTPPGRDESWNSWLQKYYKQEYNATYGGVSAQFSYQFLPMSGNANNVARIFVDYVKFSLATTRNVTSTLTGCTVTGNFYGGGSLGKVDGDVTSTITDCNMMGNVYGAGFSAALPTVEVDSIGFRTEPYYYENLGTYRTGVKSPACTTYTWRDTNVIVNSTATAIDKTKHFLYTNEDLTTLGTVSGNVNLTLGGTTTVAGDVYGGAALSSSNTGVDKTTTVTITGGTYSGNIYGGGQGDADNPVTEGNTIVNIGTAEQPGNTISIAGSVFGCNNVNGTPNGNAAVHVYRTGHTAGVDGVADEGYALPAVFGGGNVADYEPAADKGITVHVHNCDNTIAELYGGGMTANAGTAETPVTVTVIVDGGRHGDVFSGAKGTAMTGADIFGDVELNLRGGSITNAFGGSNTNGKVSGGITVNVDDDDEASCSLNVNYVFGGGNNAPYTPTTPGSYPEVNITSGTVTYDVFGGGLGATAIVTSNPVVTVDGGTVSRNVYGGGDAAGVTGNTTVQLNGGSVVGAFGGGNVADITGTTTVTIDGATATNLYGGGNQANVSSTATVNVESGTVGTGIYGGCNSSGTVGGDIEVNIHGGTLTLVQGIFGGGYGPSTSTSGNVTVNIGDEAGTHTPTITGDIYGGSALGNVNDALDDITTVNILNGTVTGGSIYGIYGGGLGDDSHAARVNGTVLVNISNSTQDEEDCHIDLRGVTVYGCNNSNGSPQGDVTVHVWKTGYTTGDYASQTGSLYAIDQVFGGGNQADYLPENGNVNSTKKATIHIHDCKNTIRRVFSGGNAAAATGVANIIEGGRFDYVFGGGNGEDIAANIGLGGTTLTVHAGKINYLFGGSNEKGTISGPSATSIDGNNAVTGCEEDISHFFSGGNQAEITGNVVTTIDCGTKQIGDIYGGSNEADIDGSVTLNIRDGSFENVFGGSKLADITGNVTVNIFGGRITNLYGGNDTDGDIDGQITVNIDHNNMQTCPGKPIALNRVYGGGRDADYTSPHGCTSSNEASPVVNIIHDSLTLYVFGGGYGSNARVTGNTQVILGASRPAAWTALGWTKRNAAIGDIVHVHNDVYGGGEAAPVTGNTRVHMRSSAGSPDNPAIVDGSVFGGGLGHTATINFRYNTLEAEKADTLTSGVHRGWPYTGNTEVDIRGERTLVVGNVYGGGNAGIVYGNTDVIIGDYQAKVVTPVITFSESWNGSTYLHSAEIVTTTNNVNLYYTTDGSDPDDGSSAYSAPFDVTPGATVKAIGLRDGYTNSDITTVVFRPVSPTPEISYIHDGEYIRAVLTTPAGASDRIWYRLGGSDPDEGNRTVYNPASKPIVTIGQEIRAYSLGMNDPGWDLSAVAASTVTAVENPVVTVDGEGHVTVTCATPGATIRYTSGATPADVTEGSTEWPGTLQLTMNQHIKVVAYKEGMVCSEQVEGVHNAVTATPAIAFGRQGANVVADITCATAGVTLLYRIGGTDPDPADVDEVNTKTFDVDHRPVITDGQVIKAIAVKAGRNNSTVATATAQIVAKPTIDIDNSGHVTITPAAGSTVRYTTDGNEPTEESTVYSAPFQAANFATVKAAGFRDGYTESDTANKRYVPTVATPTVTFQRNGSSIKAMIECTTPGAVIYWSTDGVDPTDGSLRYFPASANVTSGVTLKARAYCSYPHDWNPSAVLTVVVTDAVATPVITVSADGTSVTNITCATDGATIRYAIGNTTVTEESPIYSGGTISDLANTTFSAAAFKDGLIVSATAVKRPVSTPLIVIDNSGHVSITSATTGATIKYNTGDILTDHDHGTVYDGSFHVDPGTIVKAVAYKAGEIISDVASVTRVAEPVAAPGITVNNSTRYITLSPGVRDGVVRYTTDGTDPGIAASAYTYQFRMPGATIKAVTVLNGNLSTVTTVEPVATPTPNRVGTTVTITCVTEGATIYYTTDGTTPNTSSHRYTGPFSATIGDIITAYAVKDGMNVSENSTPLNVTAE